MDCTRHQNLVVYLTVFFVLVTVVDSIVKEDRPERCDPKPDIMYRTCCIQPPYFTRDIAKQCGARFKYVITDPDKNITAYRRYTQSDCAHWYCVLDKYSLIDNEGFVDHDKFFAHLDVWVTLNPDFSHVMTKAKRNCLMTHRIFLPLKPCEFFNLSMCIRNFVNIKCPKVVPTDECNEQKEYYRECGEYFTQK